MGARRNKRIPGGGLESTAFRHFDVTVIAERSVAIDTLHALCLSETPSPDALARLDPRRSPGDEFEVGTDIYLRLPSGVARLRS